MKPILWKNNRLELLDQTLLPHKKEYHVCQTHLDVAQAIRSMKVRGAPAIGVAAAFGMVLAFNSFLKKQKEKEILEQTLEEALREAAAVLRSARPTAANLAWAVNKMLYCAQKDSFSTDHLEQLFERKALSLMEDDIKTNMRLAEYGSELIQPDSCILTYCNTGSLATAGYGTALGVIKTAQASAKNISVMVCETRPFLQGARLTAWELQQERIPFTLITDNMAGYFMSRGKIHCVVVGADRIASNGDTANKIGTYTLAVLAKRHQIPFYVAAPFSTFDLRISDGSQIPIEERNSSEVTQIDNVKIAPWGVKVANPAFDITPSELITAIITEKGVLHPPYVESLIDMGSP